VLTSILTASTGEIASYTTEETEMKKVDQMPSEGCACCGKYAELSQWEKRKRLKWSGNGWICAACLKGKELMESSPTA
jgi:hypothetical protein